MLIEFDDLAVTQFPLMCEWNSHALSRLQILARVRSKRCNVSIAAINYLRRNGGEPFPLSPEPHEYASENAIWALVRAAVHGRDLASRKLGAERSGRGANASPSPKLEPQ